MITIGTKFVFKKQSYKDDIGIYTIDQIYTVNKIDCIYGVNYYYLEDDKGELRYFSEIKNTFYIYDYFYSVAELRDKQINSILNED
jgi:hypothetical protein